MVRDDSKRSLDMDEIIESVKAQYATMASRSREEVENWNKKKVNMKRKKKNQSSEKQKQNIISIDFIFNDKKP